MKVICPNCGNLIECKESDDTVFCNQCGSSFPYNKGKELVDKKYKQIMGYAAALSNSKGLYNEAVGVYESIFQVRPNDFQAIVEICLNTLYGMRFDDLKFTEVKNIIDSHDVMLNAENTFIYLNFVNDLLKEIKYFYKISEVRIKENGTFLNKEYFNYFRKGVLDISSLLEYIKECLSIVDANEFKDFTENVDVDFKENMKKVYEQVCESKKVIYNVNEIGDIDFDLNELGTNKKETSIDKTEDLRFIIPDYTFLKTRNITIGVFATLVIAALTLLITGTVLHNSLLQYLTFIPVVLLVATGLIFYYKIKK